ncbi:hypothetical protein, partial [Serratia marcescens]|uniref:hypothetical protein n=1 Tax=Serratia marcescens TaxID=615 RepID=UPI0013D9C944
LDFDHHGLRGTEDDLAGLDAAGAKALETAARETLSRVQRRGGPSTGRYRRSAYDIPVRLADGSALLFNARTRSLILLSPE